MVVTVCGHMPDVNKIACLNRYKSMGDVREVVDRESSPGISQFARRECELQEQFCERLHHISKLPSILVCADWVDVGQNPVFRTLITTSKAMKEAVAGSAPTEVLHAVLGANMKDVAHIECTLKDCRATLLPDLEHLSQSEACGPEMVRFRNTWKAVVRNWKAP